MRDTNGEPGIMRRSVQLLTTSVDGASLAMFRIMFGSVMAWEAYDFLAPLSGGNRIASYFYQVNWNVPHALTEWLRPWPAPWMHIQCLVMGLAAICLAVGLYSRLSAFVVFLTWTHVFLSDAAWYNNHYYLASIFALLLAVMPSGNCYSVDRQMRIGRDKSKADEPTTIPFAAIFLLRAQLVIVYSYGGLTKINADWLLEAQPLKKMLANPRIGSAISWMLPDLAIKELHNFVQTTATAHFLSRTGLLFDLVVGFMLIYRRTRILGLVLMIAFHATNHLVLFQNIGVFPVMGIATALIFLEPDWPRSSRFSAWLGRRLEGLMPHWGWLAFGAVLLPVIGAAGAWAFVPGDAATGPTWGWIAFVGIALAATGATLGWSIPPSKTISTAPTGSSPGWIPLLVGAWLVIQIVVPLRHYAIAGDWRWTDEARFWSWTMKTTMFDIDRVRMHIADPKLFDTDPNGELIVRQKWIDDSDVVYRQLDTRAIDWRSLPEVLVVYEPVCGERVIYNPWAGRETPLTKRQSRERIELIWQETYGRAPRIVAAIPLSTALESAQYAMTPRERDILAELLRIAREAAGQLAQSPEDEADFERLSNRLYFSLTRLSQARTGAMRIGDFLRQAKPFVTAGTPEVDGDFLVIGDSQLMKVARTGFGKIDRDQWRRAWPEARYVYVDWNRLKIEWKALPRVMLVQDEKLRPGAIWNPFVDLSQIQVVKVATSATMLHQYAQHIAGIWQSRFGHRPQVFAYSYIALNHHPKQLLVDPNVDLAATQLRLFSHNEWIVPLGAGLKTAPGVPE